MQTEVNHSVGVTPAKQRLFLATAKVWNTVGNVESHLPSRGGSQKLFLATANV